MHATVDATTKIYNSLPSVEQANAELEAMDRAEVLDELCRIIVDHNLQDVFGIRLLHKHNVIESHEMMVEIEELTAQGEPCLVTAPRVDFASAGSAPNSWKLSSGSTPEWHPLEYSTDAVVAECPNVETSGPFFREFRIALEKLNATEILGPCVIGREYYKRHRPGQPSILAETTDLVRRANVVKFELEEAYAKERLIQTTWQAAKTSTDSAQTTCVVACISISACVVDANGTHNKVTRHNKGSHVHNS